MYRFSISLQNRSQDCCGIKNWELSDDYFGTPLHAMNGNQTEDIRNDLIHQLARVVLYRADLPVPDEKAYVRFFRNAHLINVENVLLSESAIAGASDEEIRNIIRIAASFSIRVLLKPEADHPAETSLERYAALRCSDTGLFYDPSEYVKQHRNPYRDILYKSSLKDDIVFLRVDDMVFDTLQPVLPEHGNAQIKECASTLLARSFRGYFSFANYGDYSVSEVIPAFCQTLSYL